MVKIGDTVRFLNDVGEGVVTKIQDKNIVLVVGSDGFEIPMPITELVVVQPTDQYNFPVEEQKAKRTDPAVASDENAEDDEPEIDLTYAFNERDETEEGENLSIYLAFVPENIKQLQSTKMDFYLINDSNYYLSFNLLNGNDKAMKIAEVIEPQTKLFLTTIEKEEVNDYCQLRFQAIAFKKHMFDPKPAMDITLKQNPVKFYKLHTFSENDFFDVNAWILTICKNDVMDLALQIDSKSLQNAILEKDTNKNGNKNQEIKRPKNQEIIEVDLHIQELLDSTAGLSNADILNYQLQKFNETMQEHLHEKRCRIVFIHGKGNGILRAAIEKELRKKYHSCLFQDASFQKYGFGATMVTIR